VLGYTMLVGAINVVLITALATVGAVVYNIATHVSGGIEVTLREAD
jgi:Flp pilus assembly pilin Flp